MAAIEILERQRKKRNAEGERGSELIEFALVFPLLLMVVLAIVDFGFMFQRYEVVTNAEREGARIAVLAGYSRPHTHVGQSPRAALGLCDSD